VLLFIDNIFHFTQANSEVSASLGCIPSAIGYQPTLATDLGGLQERITTKKGSITSVQAIYVPADDLTDPAPTTTFAHLDATTVLSRQISNLGKTIKTNYEACLRNDDLWGNEALGRQLKTNGWKDSIITLHTTKSFFPWSENLQIIS
jgi:hypothetical protein